MPTTSNLPAPVLPQTSPETRRWEGKEEAGKQARGKGRGSAAKPAGETPKEKNTERGRGGGGGRRERKRETNIPSTNHPLRPLPVPEQRGPLDQVLHNLFLARGQAEVGQAVLVGDGLVGEVAEGEDEGYYYACSFFLGSIVSRGGLGWGVGVVVCWGVGSLGVGLSGFGLLG